MIKLDYYLLGSNDGCSNSSASQPGFNLETKNQFATIVNMPQPRKLIKKCPGSI